MRGLVSVIVPCFNYARFLDDCLASLIRQSYEQWECIVIDRKDDMLTVRWRNSDINRSDTGVSFASV